MNTQIDSNLLSLLQETYEKDPSKYQIQVADDENWQKFIARFPIENLHTLTLEDYCLGKGSQPENFSWYIERGLIKPLGRYSPGTSKGHLIYKEPDGSYYRHRFFEEKSDNEALDIVLRVIQLIAQSQSLNDAKQWDSKKAIGEALKSDVKIPLGDARRLRLFHVYNPTKMLSINSPDHLKHFLKIFGFEESALPSTPFALASMLWNFYLSIESNFPGVTPKGFTNLIYLDELGIRPQKREKVTSASDDIEVADIVDIPRNTILYGPPGTGKTYETVTRAVQILDKDYYLEYKDNRSNIHTRFTDLLSKGHVGFVTFHQSFSYEEFVEGLKIQSNEDGSIRYEIEDGIFKTLCQSAASKVTVGVDTQLSVTGKRIWKMSLGNTLGDDAYVYDECIESGCILFGYGDGIDFTNANTKAEIYQRFKEAGFDVAANDYAVTSVARYILEMQIGDIVVVTDGNRKFRAIGEITSDYDFQDRTDQLDYKQKRSVSWRRVYSPSRPFEDLMNNSFSQMTLYELKERSINISRLEELLSTNL